MTRIYSCSSSNGVILADMKLINVEPKNNYFVRIYLDDSILDFEIRAELERIPCYKPLYDPILEPLIALRRWI